MRAYRSMLFNKAKKKKRHLTERQEITSKTKSKVSHTHKLRLQFQEDAPDWVGFVATLKFRF